MKTEWFKVDDTKSRHHAKRICEKASRAHTHMQETNLYMYKVEEHSENTHTTNIFYNRNNRNAKIPIPALLYVIVADFIHKYFR